jgi:hypothetical protein
MTIYSGNTFLNFQHAKRKLFTNLNQNGYLLAVHDPARVELHLSTALKSATLGTGNTDRLTDRHRHRPDAHRMA